MGSNLGSGTWLLVLPVTNAHLESIPNLPTLKKKILTFGASLREILSLGFGS
jgi:hypothetical protein